VKVILREANHRVVYAPGRLSTENERDAAATHMAEQHRFGNAWSVDRNRNQMQSTVRQKALREGLELFRVHVAVNMRELITLDPQHASYCRPVAVAENPVGRIVTIGLFLPAQVAQRSPTRREAGSCGAGEAGGGASQRVAARRAATSSRMSRRSPN